MGQKSFILAIEINTLEYEKRKKELVIKIF